MDISENLITNPMHHWYYAYKYKHIERFIIKYCKNLDVIIDVGAGSGVFSKEIAKKNTMSKFILVDKEYCGSYFDQENSNLFYTDSHTDSKANLYLFNDILEHVEDDVTFLGAYVNPKNVDSKYIITVPAMQILWSGHDVYLKHFRRYNKKMLLETLRKSNLNVLEVRYLYSVVFPIAWLRRTIIGRNSTNSELKEHNAITNYFFKLLMIFDLYTSRFASFGVSLIAIAENKS